MVNKYDNYELRKVSSLENIPGTIKDGDGYIWDPSGLPDNDFDVSKVPLEYRRLATWMRSKLFGKEVRETIARLAEMFGLNFKELMDSFESLNDNQESVETFLVDFIQAATDAEVNSGPEIIQARGGKDTLGARLDETTAQLVQVEQQKISHGEVTVYDIDKNKGKLDQTFMTEEFLQQMAGNTPVNTVPSDESITSEKLAPRAVAYDKTDFIVGSTNLFDKRNLKDGTNINLTTGAELSNTNYKSTQFIKIYPGNYVGKHIYRRVFYDSEKKAISGDEADGAFTVPSTAVYVRFVISNDNLNNAQVNRGSTLLPYENHYKKMDDKIRVRTVANQVNVGEAKFIENRGTNLYNFRNITRGKSVDATTGAVVDNATHSVTDYIKLTPSTNYIARRIALLAYYDEAKELISRANMTDGVPNLSPANTAYGIAVVVTGYYDSAQLNEGSTLLGYEDYGLEVDGYRIKNKVEESDITLFKPKSKNLFNRETVYNLKTINDTNGELRDNNYHHVSSLIEVTPSSSYTVNKIAKVGMYNRGGKFIRSFAAQDGLIFETSADCYFIRVVIDQYSLGRAQVNKGNTLVPYDTYDLMLNGKELRYKGSFKDDQQYLLDGTLDELYRNTTITGDPNIINLQTSEIYAFYDELVTKHAPHATKAVLGQDSRGDNIVRYDFNFGHEASKPAKVILISGMHGEKTGILNLYHTIKAICDDWQENETLETLRYNFHFIVVPVVNIYGVNNAVRKNENGVDLCRNFPEGWVSNPDTSSSYYPGTAPMSERGTQMIYELLQANQDAVLFNSSHNFSTEEGTMLPKDFMYTAGVSTLQADATEKVFAKLSRKWKQENAWLPQDDTVFGYAVKGSQNGSEIRQGGAFGIFSSAFEVTQNFHLETNPSNFSSTVLTFGADAYLNWLAYNLKTILTYRNNN